MFRAAANGPYDDIVVKATNENLTSEDWGAIIEVCDKVSSDPSGPKEAVQSLIKRLAHRNANVQLYTLEVAHALCQNCGQAMHREVSSRAFTDALLRLANDRNTHQQVKAKILEKMKEWSDMFSKDADLGIMYDAYYRLKQTNPSLQPPSAPQKQGLTQSDRQKEEDELQMALKLSLQEEERKKSVSGGAAAPASGGSGSGAGASSQADADAAQGQGAQPVPSGTTAATVSRVRALYDFVPSEPGELEFKMGDVIAVLESVYKDWWRGSLKGKTGIFPLNYVEKLADPTPDELRREAQMEQEVFAEIKNVEKLLTLLSTSNTAPREEDNEEISKLYHQTLAIRPKLIKLIEKYSQKKDDFTQLNEKFIKARRDYEALLESSMSHPPQHNYHQYAMRPGPPGAGVGPGYASYGQAPPPGQDPNRFYTPAPQAHPGDRPPFNTSSPPPPSSNYPPQQQGTPAPFYMGGAEVPPHNAQHHYPARDQGPPMGYPNASAQQAGPAHPTSSPPPQRQPQYVPYSQGPSDPYSQGQRPQSTYGAQELATSVYDSPIAPTSSHHNLPEGQSVPPAVSSPPPPSAPTQDEAPPPHQQAYFQHPSQPGPPGADVMSPPPLHPSGAAYDSRQGMPGQQPMEGGQPQYQAYVPPGANNGPSAPADYYRQNVY